MGEGARTLITGAYVVTMDDDLQNPPEEVVKLWSYAKETGYDVVYTYFEEKKHSLFRNLGSQFTNFCANFLLDKPKGLYLCFKRRPLLALPN